MSEAQVPRAEHRREGSQESDCILFLHGDSGCHTLVPLCLWTSSAQVASLCAHGFGGQQESLETSG